MVLNRELARADGSEETIKMVGAVLSPWHPNLKVGENEKLRIHAVHNAEGLLVWIEV
jgi:hypothetical protein